MESEMDHHVGRGQKRGVASKKDHKDLEMKQESEWDGMEMEMEMDMD